MALSPLYLAVALLLDDPANTAARRIAVRAPEGLFAGPSRERMTGWARREGAQLDIGPEGKPVPVGWESLHLSLLPASEGFRRLVARFPVRLEEKEFHFDGRAYRGPQDAIVLTDPARPAGTFVVGTHPQTVLRLAGTRLFWNRREETIRDYEVLSNGLSKHGRFERRKVPLSVDRDSDRDEITAKDDFFRSLKTEESHGVRWRLRESERAAVARWEPVLRRFLRKGQRGGLEVFLFPDPATKGLYRGSSRPADLAREGSSIRVDLDVSAPAEPDLITPVLAAAAYAAEDVRLLTRPTLLLALGAQACGRWWGRDVASFGAFVDQARVAPSRPEVLKSDEEVSPVLAVGAAASWVAAGIRSEGEVSVLRALVGGDSDLERALEGWASKSRAHKVASPARRSLPGGFLRGISYAMSNSTEGSYASPRSRETLERLAKMSVNSVSVMPYAYSRSPSEPRISFVHRSPAGETDEGTVRAVCDARALGMTAMVKPHVWLGGGAFVGEVAMSGEENWNRWFDAYRRFVVHNAVVAEASGAALFCVGTELVGTEGRVREWRETIAAVRLATGASLLYASNWAAGAPKISFWNALDAVGVDFYDPLSTDPLASDAALEAGARRAAEPLALLVRRTGKPVIFAEAGYPPVRGAWIAPHDENTGRPRGPEDAARAISAVFRALDGESWWKGVYWWKAFSGGQNARGDERGFNILGTSSERAIAEGFAHNQKASR